MRFFVVSSVFHYLGPAFAVLLFARVEPVGVAVLRIWSAALVFALWRRFRWDRTVVAWGVVLAGMNVSFYMAIARLPLGTVAAIEFLPVVGLAALGARTPRNVVALLAVVGGVYALVDVRLEGEPLGFVLAFLNAALFAFYIVLAHRSAQRSGAIGGLGAAMAAAAVLTAPGLVVAGPALTDPLLLAAGAGVGICSSVIPYVCDQLAMARLARETYALMVALLPATAVVIGVIVLRQVPSAVEALGVAFVIFGVALHSGRTESLKEKAWNTHDSAAQG
ncbi:EamA family transporter [Actinomadura rudentiformis]|uniref:EamA family transporter n=1 Tax=Actinomadura rudentiformis TaxID=359158 RepID=A0A6H9YXA6_9ACTN|nr:EamA family transporter [Actinomadura rudentiformis]KAB2351847.1 EamA family transporter [Actinomadura rudentiformis]